MALLKGHTEDILALLLSRDIGRIDLHYVVAAFFLGAQDCQCLLGVSRGDHSVGDLIFQVGSRCGVTCLAQSSPVTVGTEPIGAAGSDIGTGNRRELSIIGDEIDMPVCLGKRQSDSCTGG